jgi:predicted adenine nucleotide alpha hydrolase (AANH) superfamily ATPase
MPSLLVHTCCGPCACGCFDRWRQEGFQVTSFWYNPNIHPYAEHQKRLQTLQDFFRKNGTPLVVSEGYDVVRYFRAVVGHEDDRCRHCFRLRLSATASAARERGFEAFTTTLLISPYPDQGLLKQIGEEIAQGEGLRFISEDMRLCYPDSRRISQEMDLYRQKYCGCIYSEWERSSKKTR